METGKMRFVKRILCMFLAAACVFFTGCSPILFNGDLHFQSYPPTTVPVIYDEIQNEIEDTQAEYDENRFTIEGKDAFYILPYHESDPDKIVDFQLLDYTEAGTFVYAYLTPYSGSDLDTAMGTTPVLGQVQRDGSIRPVSFNMLSEHPLAEDPLDLNEDRMTDMTVYDEDVLPQLTDDPIEPEVRVEEGEVVEVIVEPAEDSESAVGAPPRADGYEDALGQPPIADEYEVAPDQLPAESQGQNPWWVVGSAAPAGFRFMATGLGSFGIRAHMNLAAQILNNGASQLGQPPLSAGDTGIAEAQPPADDDGIEWGIGEPPAAVIVPNYYALVLMAYNPDNRVYKVFYSSVLSEEREVVNGAEDLESEITDLSIMANRLVKSEQYFIYDDYVGHVYDREGNELFRNEYTSAVQSAGSQLKTKAGRTDGTVTVENAVMDGYYYAYITVSYELSEDASGGSDDWDDVEDLDQSIYTAVICCVDYDIGGENSPTPFYSESLVWQDQVKAWQDAAGIAEYESLKAAKEAASKYSMDRIRSGDVLHVPDSFSAFQTGTAGGNHVELHYASDIFSSKLAVVKSDGGSIGNFNIKMSSLIAANPETSSYWKSRFVSLYYGWLLNSQKNLFWHDYFRQVSGYGTREQRLRTALATLTLLANGDYATVAQWSRSAARSSGRLYVPKLYPGKWKSDKGRNESPLKESFKTQNNDSMEAILGYQTTSYETTGSQSSIGTYVAIHVPNRAVQDATISYRMIPVEYLNSVSRTFIYYTTTTTKDADGNKVTTRVRNQYTETLPAGSYPIKYQMVFMPGTKMTGTTILDTGELVAPSGDIGAVYYADVERNTDSAEDEEPPTSRIRYVSGTGTFLNSVADGQSMEAGILYYKDQSNQETEVVTYITSEGIAFYKRNGTNFSRLRFVSGDQLAVRASGYGLITTGDTAIVDTSTDPTYQVSEKQDSIITNRLESGGGLDSYSMDNFSLLNHNEVLIASLNNGLFMLNLNNGLSIGLQSGTYYSAFEYGNTGARKYMVVGFNTEDYYYQPSDIVKAKCYSMDLAAQNAALEKEAQKLYLDSLANNYLNRTHRLTWSEDKKQYSVTRPTDAEKTANLRAERLFYGSEASMQSELGTIVKELGFDSVSTEVAQYAADLRVKLQLQREKLTEFYELAGVGSITGTPTNPNILMQEGYLIGAQYTSALEDILVGLKLSDEAINRMPTNRAQYKEYQTQLKTAKLMTDVGYMDNLNNDNDRIALENMACYRAVLDDLKEAYNDRQYSMYGSIVVTWDEYIRGLLMAISPDNAINQRERAFEELCRLADLDANVIDMEVLREQVSDIRLVADLELLIIQYHLNTARYQNSPYKQEFAAFSERSFDSNAEKTSELQKCGFYQIIKDLQASSQDLLDKNITWEGKMRDILATCGGGVVLSSEDLQARLQ